MLRTGSALDLAIRARREAYEASLDALRADVSVVRDAVVARPATDETGV